MPTATSRTFKSGNSVAVRLPREVAFEPGVEVTIERAGDLITIRPKRPSVAQMIARLRELPTPGQIEVRDADVVPDRPGL
jgi:antitoxin VapB